MNAPRADIELPGTCLGLLSDSHGDAEITRRAVSLLIEGGADALLHLGDVCSISVIDALAGLSADDGRTIPSRLLWGNMDFDTDSGRRYAESIGVGVDHPAGSYLMEGRRLLAHHGHLDRFERLAPGQGYDYFLHGHTHRPRDEVIEGLRRLNPGALTRADRLTAALLWPADGEFRLIDVPS